MLITFEYPPNTFGGIGSFNYELAKGFSKNGIEVVVVAGGRSDLLSCRKSGIKAYFLKAPALRPREFYFQIYNAERISKIVKKERPDVIQLNSGFNFFLKVLKNRGNYDGAIVQVLHGSPSPFSRLYEDLRDLNVYDIVWSLTLHAHNSLSELIVNSLEYTNAFVHVAKHVMYYNLNYSRLSEKLREKINVVIYPGINVEDFERLRCKISRSDKKRKSLIFGARLVPYKGITCLLEAFKLACREDKEINLNVFGDGPLRQTVIRMIKDMQRQGIRNVHYYGNVPREDFLRKLAMSQILVHPSLYESVGLVLIESSLLGTPVLTHEAPYSEEFVKKLGIGKTVNIRDIEKFANSIISIVNDDELIYKVTKSLEIICRLFNVNESMKKYIELYQRLI